MYLLILVICCFLRIFEALFELSASSLDAQKNRKDILGNYFRLVVHTLLYEYNSWNFVALWLFHSALRVQDSFQFFAVFSWFKIFQKPLSRTMNCAKPIKRLLNHKISGYDRQDYLFWKKNVLPWRISFVHVIGLESRDLLAHWTVDLWRNQQNFDLWRYEWFYWGHTKNEERYL